MICTNDTMNNTLTYHAYDFVNDKEIVFAGIQVRLGEAVFMSHFERVQFVPSLEAAPATLRATAGEAIPARGGSVENSTDADDSREDHTQRTDADDTPEIGAEVMCPVAKALQDEIFGSTAAVEGGVTRTGPKSLEAAHAVVGATAMDLGPVREQSLENSKDDVDALDNGAQVM